MQQVAFLFAHFVGGGLVSTGTALSGPLYSKARGGGDRSQLGVMGQECVKPQEVTDVHGRGQMDGLQRPDHGCKSVPGTGENAFGNENDMKNPMNEFSIPSKLHHLRVINGRQKTTGVQSS